MKREIHKRKPGELRMNLLESERLVVAHYHSRKHGSSVNHEAITLKTRIRDIYIVEWILLDSLYIYISVESPSLWRWAAIFRLLIIHTLYAFFANDLRWCCSTGGRGWIELKFRNSISTGFSRTSRELRVLMRCSTVSPPPKGYRPPWPENLLDEWCLPHTLVPIETMNPNTLCPYSI